MAWRQLHLYDSWPWYMNKVVFAFYYLKATVGICGLKTVDIYGTPMNISVYVSIPLDIEKAFDNIL